MPGVIAFVATSLGVTGGVTVVAATATAAAVTISYATLIGYAVTIGASVAYAASQNAKMRNLANALTDTGRNVMARDPLASQRGIYGEIPVSGPIFFMHTTGGKNEVLHVIMGIAGHQCNDLGTIYFDGPDGLETVPLDGAGAATGKYAGKFICKKHLGTNVQAAEALLVAAAPAKWTAAHKLLGTAYLYLQYTYDTTLYPNGLPVTKCLTQGKLLMDPRVGIYQKTCDVTAGNRHVGCADCSSLAAGMRVQGPQIVEGTRIVSIDGSGTFFTVDTDPLLTNATARLACGVVAFSKNSALCAADYLSDFKLGRGVSWYRINTASLPAEANTCEESILLEDGVTHEQRYNTNGSYTSDQDALPDLLSAMAGRKVDTGGLVTILAGVYRSPAVGADFTDDDLVGAFQLQPRQSMRDSYSGVRGTYISPDNAWQPSDFPRIKNNEYTRQDGGRRRWKDVAYPFTISAATAQRLAKSDMERGRQQIIFQAIYKLKAFKVACCDTIRITSTTEGWVTKEFEVLTWGLRIIGQGTAMIVAVALTCRETAPEVYDWAGGEETAVDLAPNTTLPNPSVVPTPTGLTLLTDATTVFHQQDGTSTPRIKVSWNTPNNIFIESGGFTEIEYKLSTDATFIPWSSPRGDALFDYITDVKIGLQYHVRLRFRNTNGAVGLYCGTVTSAAVFGGVAPPDYGGTALVSYEKAPVQITSGVRRYSILLVWAEILGSAYAYPADFAYWEVKATATNADGAVDYNADAGSGTAGLYRTVVPAIGFFNDTGATSFIRFRPVNTSGQAGAWYGVGSTPINQRPFGDAVNKNVGTTAGTVAAGDDSRVTGAAQKASNLSDLSSATTARSNLGLGTAAVKNVNNMGALTVGVLSSDAADSYTPQLGTGTNNVSFKWSGTEFHFRIDVSDFFCPSAGAKTAAIADITGGAVTVAEDHEARLKIDAILALLRTWNQLTP